MMFTRVMSELSVALAVIAFGATAPGADSALGAESRHGEQPASPGSGHDTQPGHSEQGQDGGRGSGNINPLKLEEIQADLAIWTAVVFLVLLAALWPFWRRIAQELDKRERGIADQIAQAEHHNAEARKLLEAYEQKLAASGEEVQQMLERARRDAEQAGQRIVQEARADAEAEHQRMLGEVELAAADALKQLAEQSATLAVELAGKIVAAELDPKGHAHLIKRAVARFSTQQPGDD
jgi:F-type H+-transporting ATPase subunit b